MAVGCDLAKSHADKELHQEEYATTVSVIIPAYNRASTIPRAINSVLVQTFYDLKSSSSMMGQPIRHAKLFNKSEMRASE